MNKLLCLVCNTTLESKSRHDFQQCTCPNEAFTDGGEDYQRYGAVDLDLVKILDG